MKKFSVILIVVALVASMAFADISGSATVYFGYDIDEKSAGFSNDSGVALNTTLISEVGSAKGEGAIYAEIKGSMAIVFATENQETNSYGYIGGSDQALPGLLLDAYIESASIMSDNWSVGITGTGYPFDFASSVIDYKTSYSTVSYYDDNGDLVVTYTNPSYSKTYVSMRPRDIYVTAANGKLSANMPAGITWSYDDFSGSFGFESDADGAIAYFVGGTKASEVAEGLKIGAAANFFLSTVDTVASLFGGSFKADYTGEQVSAVVASDFAYRTAITGLDAKLILDASAKIKALDIVTVDAYFATDAFKRGGSYDTGCNLLSAKASFALDPLTVSVTGKDLLAAKKLSASTSLDVNENINVAPYGSYKLSDSSYGAGCDLTYSDDSIYAFLEGEYSSDGSLYLYLEASTDAVIDGATLGFYWEADDLLASGSQGCPSLYATIEF